MKTVLMEKSIMQTVFDQDGQAVAATGLFSGNCFFVGTKDKEKDGYDSYLGFAKKNGLKILPQKIVEILPEEEKLEIGQELKLEEIFKEGDLVSVTGISKGKGFAGVVKRWGFHGGPKTHGQSDRQRGPGSSGPTTTPGKVHKGKRRAGRMGSVKTTVKNLKVVKVDPENKLLWVTGSVPGIKGNLLVVRKTK
jgi:large subunit ribosomal protein L3